MKLDSNVIFADLIEIRKSCGAALAPVTPINITVDSLKTGKAEINLNHFLIYRAESGMNFHFMKCGEIRKFETPNQYLDWLKSYRFTNNTSGLFEVYTNLKNKSKKYRKKILSEEPKLKKLHVCGKCISEWNELQTGIILNNVTFNINEFFDYCDKNPHLSQYFSQYLIDSNFIEKHKIFSSTVRNDYPYSWKYLTNIYRAAKNYQCKICGVNLQQNGLETQQIINQLQKSRINFSDYEINLNQCLNDLQKLGFDSTPYWKKYKGIILTHHVNGNHFDVHPENMRVICKKCHSEIHKDTKDISPTVKENTIITTLLIIQKAIEIAKIKLKFNPY